MHMADALVSPAVAVTMYAASAAAAGVSLVQLHKEEAAAPELAKKKLPTMAVMSALVFAGQMINYTIPGTGSSGHLCGGMLLSAILGPWAGFLSMIVILAIQALFFADGGDVHHVAMYLGDGRYIHSTSKAGSDGVVLNSLCPGHPLYRHDLATGVLAVGSIF